jgi:two-component system, NtrC family, sensor histidine kinase HydH
MGVMPLPRLLFAAGIILTGALAWFAVVNYQGARPIAEQNLKGVALSLAEAMESLAARDPSLESLTSFRAADIAYYALIDRNGVQQFHANPSLIGTPVTDRRFHEVFTGNGMTESRQTLRTGEEVFEINTPFHLQGQTLALRMTLHTYRADSVVRRARIGLVIMGALLLTAWVMGIFLYRFARREEQHRNEMARRERMAHLGEMGAVLAHEIRNPLAGIKGYSQLLQEQIQGSLHMAYLELIITETLRLEELVSALMSYSRQEQVSPEAVDLSSLLKHSLALILPETEGGGIIQQTFFTEGAIVFGNRNSLEQVMLNLLKNALQAMPDGGTLRAEVHHFTRDVVVTVTDTGPGVPPENRELIFEPFHTTKPRGTGLGLAVCRKIVEEHGGTITVGGEPGNGAIFTITLPLNLKG